MMAVLMGKEKAVKVLLDNKHLDYMIPEKDGYTPCHGAGFQGRAAIMRMLLAAGLPCTTDTHADGFTPLHRACWGREPRHTETVRARGRDSARVLLRVGVLVAGWSLLVWQGVGP